MANEKTSFLPNIKKGKDLPELGLISLPPMKIRIRPKVREIYVSPSMPSKYTRCLESRQKAK